MVFRQLSDKYLFFFQTLINTKTKKTKLCIFKREINIMETNVQFCVHATDSLEKFKQERKLLKNGNLKYMETIEHIREMSTMTVV